MPCNSINILLTSIIFNDVQCKDRRAGWKNHHNLLNILDGKENKTKVGEEVVTSRSIVKKNQTICTRHFFVLEEEQRSGSSKNAVRGEVLLGTEEYVAKKILKLI